MSIKKSRTYVISDTGKVWPKLVTGLVLVLVIMFLVLTFSLFRTSNALMNKKGKEFNPIASHLMPRYDAISFKPYQSDLTLNGWFFASKDEFRGNVIIVHHNGQDKLQYELDTANLFQFFIDNGFNVFAIDLRHSGQSQGDSSSFGFAEYRDVIGAMGKLYQISGRKNFILYGIGSGTTASLLAWNDLPEEISEEQRKGADKDDPLLSKEDIIGFILDTPTASAYDYIRAELKKENFLQKHIFTKYVPDIVRMSSNGPEIINLIPIVGHIDVPVMITRNLPDTKLNQASSDAFISECARLKSESSYITEIPIAGHLDAFTKNKEQYLDDLNYFLNIWY